ncbi:MAG TPA: hypothetical protein VHY37_10800 [Tepidisphaeraceae bacterium]|jgi:hypothetical protein|nr:hypothetical protein [Tepidisphaeraceae bacterium]
MLRTSFALLVAGAVAGCSASANFTPMASSSGQTQEELSAYAGHASYPATMPASNELKAAAMVSPDQKMLKIYNFGHEPIDNADVWVNGSFVYHVNTVAPDSSVTISASQLFNSAGASLSSQGTPVSRVQIKTENGLYNLMGPAAL